MFVAQLLPAARERLVTISENAPLVEAAGLLRAGADLVVVCGPDGVATGVVTKTDIVSRLSECEIDGCLTAASLMMSQDLVLCRSNEELHDVWLRMKERGVKNVPIVEDDGRPLGMLNARDVLLVLLNDAEYEDAMLRDYVMGVGYQ